MNEPVKEHLAPIFAQIANPTTGELGHPQGQLAYAYVRVSTSGQAEDGRSGLPRQLQHIHECAERKHLRVSFDLLYCDDHTGFEFQDRPDLQRLLTDIGSVSRPAHHLVIENLDRLSRNAKWHQGYLLDVFEQSKVTLHFWKAFHSDIEHGEFIANRFYINHEWSERSQKMVRRQRQRPKEEWVIVPVPKIVSPQIWEEAGKALKRNLKCSTRNAKRPCLLQGFITCACCDYNYGAGGSSGPIVNGERTRRFYMCGSYNQLPTVREQIYCGSPYVYSDVIDPHVWSSVCKLITDPNILINYIQEEHDKFKQGELTNQLSYIERQLQKCQQEERQWDKAYGAGIFGLEEYSDKKKTVSMRRKALQKEQEKIAEEMAIVEMFEKKRELIFEHLNMLKESGFALDMPFKDKRKIIAMLIDRVVVNSKDGWYRLERVIEGTYSYEDTSQSGDGEQSGGANQSSGSSFSSNGGSNFEDGLNFRYASALKYNKVRVCLVNQFL